ncbi:MAG: flagella basal body P-ring formation protein FlgA [Burkholderiales bacterium RIFCSPLOWO2_12_FULL_61_40]|nr:MAG: flagella basal body P-ring formation protein FlgA [Burkholderiales bacterium RIFCSPLOWO2_12_FULL_61_40]
MPRSAPLFQTSSLRRYAAMAVAMALQWVAVSAWAQAQSGAELQKVAQNWLHAAVANAQPEALRMEVSVGAVDGRLKLAPCANVDAYLPVGSRLWGKTRVGLRCIDGMARWNVSVPATITALGNAWVVKGHVPAGAVLRESDVVESEVDWAEEVSPVLQDRSAWLGQVATRLLTTGQTLRQGMVKPAQVFQAGTQVRVVAQGVGFQISGDGQALSAGVLGQSARVRMENGRVASGVVLDSHTVKIDL